MIVSRSRSPISRAVYNRDHERGRAATQPPIDQRNSLDPAFATCETGTNQSPVDISGAVPGGGPSLQFRYPDNEWSSRTPDM